MTTFYTIYRPNTTSFLDIVLDLIWKELSHFLLVDLINVIIFGVDMRSSLHGDNKKKDILILGEGPTQGLDDTTLTAEKKYWINFAEHNKVFIRLAL